MDIGGGTSNLALIEDGKILQTGCLNVGGRLVKVDEGGTITYLSPVARQLSSLQEGQRAEVSQLEELAEKLVQGLEMAAGLREVSPLWEKLVTRESAETQPISLGAVISFSGGVADCIEKDHPPFAFGDMGPILGKAIRNSRLCSGEYMLAENTIRATVIGAGCHSATLSGSTVFYRDVALPMKNLPVAELDEKAQFDPAAIARALQGQDAEQVVLAMPGVGSPDYEVVSRMAQAIADSMAGKAGYICLQADMAKALGHALALRLPEGNPCLCIDRVALTAGDYLDVGQPVGPALPVVVKTLVLSSNCE
jgi:ethanolamine utilization protein EutA